MDDIEASWRLFRNVLLILSSIVISTICIKLMTTIMEEMTITMEEFEGDYTEFSQETAQETEPTTISTRAPTTTSAPIKTPSVYIAGDVNTGDKYNITNESQKVDYSMTIIAVVALITIPTFIVIMTIIILKHKQNVREHTENVLCADLKTFEQQEINELKQKYN